MNTHFEAFFGIYKTRKNTSITSAFWDFNLKTKKNASGKRPPDEAHGSRDETIRPQRSSEAERSSEKKVQSARCSDSASRARIESKNICL